MPAIASSLWSFAGNYYFYMKMYGRRKNATTNLPISIGDYACSTSQEAKEMGKELSYYHFSE